MSTNGPGAIAAIAGPPVSVPRGTFPTGSITITATGVPGQRSADLAANVTAQITSQNPNVVVILIGANDYSGAIDAPTYGSNVQSIVTQVRAWSSTVPIALVSPTPYYDTWTAGPPANFVSEGNQALLDGYSAQLQTIAGSNSGVTFVNSTAIMLADEQINNAPAPGTEIFYMNERHPVIPTGQVELGSCMVRTGAFVASP